ncbi:MAG: type 1 glutamine amidotransferase-like domain-containing protein [Oligoflexia bacterium]|nr:type 1 glutamine amidotransferase-like domain-containing protein [Oligoflexia bacterium]
MKLAFYGGGELHDNDPLNEQVIHLSGTKKPKITFIPSTSYEGELDFFDYVTNFRRHGLKRFMYFPIDVPYDHVLLDEAFDSDVIHLGGGNTYYFLNWLRKTKMITRLKKYVKEGGVLTGLSAGGIIMTPDITTAGYPHFDKDDNEDGIRNLKALNLVKFDFFPHYRNSKKYDKELSRESGLIERPLYAIPDGSGIVVNGENITFCGKSWMFLKGKKTILK